MSARIPGDWILWGALGCTLIGTAHAEYTLATATGVHWFVAASVPGALDLYVIRALQMHRDVFASVLAMVVINVASHLVTAGVLPMHWGLISAVGALAPLVLWRIHYLWRQGALPVPEVSAPALEESAPAPVWDRDYIPEWMQQRVQAEGKCTRNHPECEGGVKCLTYWDAGAPALIGSAHLATATNRQGAPAPDTVPALSADALAVLDSDTRNGGRTSMRALRAEYGWGQVRATSARTDADQWKTKEETP